jgi:hypothetical protein
LLTHSAWVDFTRPPKAFCRIEIVSDVGKSAALAMEGTKAATETSATVTATMRFIFSPLRLKIPEA